VSGYDVAMSALRDRFATRWAALRPTIPVEMPNSEKSFDGTVFTKPASTPYARLSYQSDSGTERIAAGDESACRIFGRLQFEIFVPTKAGDLIGRQIAADFASIWRGHPIAGFLFLQDVQLIDVGRAFDDASRWKYDALQPFEYEFQP
jgi:hypothetical protein